MTDKLVNYGFVRPQIDIEKHYVLGGLRSLPKDILQANGQWDDYMPTYEPQFGEGWDTDGCTVWGTLNALEFIFKKIFGIEANFSERFTYNLVPVRPPGSDPHKVSDTIHARGVIDNDKLPMTKTFEEFCLPSPMSAEFLIEGQQWLIKYGFGHEWVFEGAQSKEKRIALMKQALQYSPLGVSVTAWIKDGEVYIDGGQPNCHWCVCFGYTDEGFKIFDSYDQSVKIYSYDAAIDFCKRFSLTALSGNPVPEKKNCIASAFEKLFGFSKLP